MFAFLLFRYFFGVSDLAHPLDPSDPDLGPDPGSGSGSGSGSRSGSGIRDPDPEPDLDPDLGPSPTRLDQVKQEL